MVIAPLCSMPCCSMPCALFMEYYLEDLVLVRLERVELEFEVAQVPEGHSLYEGDS